jgi:hypothetical protein
MITCDQHSIGMKAQEWSSPYCIRCCCSVYLQRLSHAEMTKLRLTQLEYPDRAFPGSMNSKTTGVATSSVEHQYRMDNSQHMRTKVLHVIVMTLTWGFRPIPFVMVARDAIVLVLVT